MNYQKITKNDTANGDGIRVTLWVSGCIHHCEGCHNPQTWNPNSGKPFDDDTMHELLEVLDKPWIDGLTLSGGDPLHILNVQSVAEIVEYVKRCFPTKNIWCYTGFTLDTLIDRQNFGVTGYHVLDNIDILVDGKYKKELRDVSFPWAGSSNQRIWANINGEWVQSEYDKIYREASNAKICRKADWNI